MNLRHDLARLLRGIADTIDPPLVLLSMPLEEYMDVTLDDLRDQLAAIARSN